MTTAPRRQARGPAPCLVLILSALLLGGCAGTPQTRSLLADPPQDLVTAAELEAVPFNPQNEYQCGPAALATLLQTTDVPVTPDELVRRVYIPERQGSLQVEMIATARQYNRIPYMIEPRLDHLLREVRAGRPVLVLQNLGIELVPVWHYAVVVGYDLERRELILRSGEIERHPTSMATFEHTWRRSDHWGFVLLRPGEIPATANERGYFLALAAFARHGEAGDLETAYLAGIKRWPESLNLRMGLGNLYYRQDKPGPAGEAYRRALAIDGDYAPAHNNLAQVMLEQGQVNQALEHARRAVALGGRHGDQYRKTLEQIQSRAD